MSTKNILQNKESYTSFIVLSLSLLVWRIWTIVFLWIGWYITPNKLNFLGGGLEEYLRLPAIFSWANFDGEHYLSIARYGYGNFEQAFFPLYPKLIEFVSRFTGKTVLDYCLSGLFISHVFLVGAICIFYKLIRLDYDNKVATKTIIFFLLYPASFFIGGVYTESLFLFLILSSFYSARKGSWLLAGIFGAIASATRLTGIFVLPALLWEWWQQNKENKTKIDVRKVINLLPVFITGIGLLWYMGYLFTRYGDPLMFVNAQPNFGANRVVDRVILIYQVFWRYFKMIIETKIDPIFYTVWLELITTIGFIGLLILSFVKKIRVSYIVFSVLSLLLPTLTGTFSSMPRYVIVLFPCFIVLGLIENSKIQKLVSILFLIIMVVTICLFTRGYFIG